jgi:hypothetical protein
MKAALASLLAYVAAVAWLTWPLAAHVTTHLPATRASWRYDALYGLWALAHETRALASDPALLFESDIFHPAPRTLFYGPLALGALPTFAPGFLATGNPTLAMNVTFLAALALTAWTLHLVVRRWSGSHLAGAVAATTWLTTPYVHWWFIPTAPYYGVLFYLPLIALLAATPLDSARSCAALALLVAIQSLTEVVYVAPAVFVPLGLLALARCLRRDTRMAGLRLGAVLALAALPLVPLVAGYLSVRAANPDLSQQTPWPGPEPMQLPWDLLHPRSPVGVAVSALALIGAGWLAHRRSPVRLPGWNHAALWAAVGVLMSLTRVVVLGGRPYTPPQFLLAQWVGFQDPLRVPTRLGVAGLIGLCLLAGLAFAACAGRLRAAWGWRAASPLLAAILIGAMYGEYVYGVPGIGREPAPARYPIATPPAPPARLLRLVAEHGGPTLQMPLGRDGVGPPDHARAMYHAIFHGRPVLNGYSSYWPAGFRQRMALAERLPDPSALATLRRETGLALILVESRYFEPPVQQLWRTLAEKPPPEIRLLAREGDDLLFVLVR